MKIEVAYPPNFDAVREAFPLAAQPGVLFAYGDTIYNPSGVGIPTPLREHEEEHGRRQRACGVEEWWERYLADRVFRYEEELLAHAAELASLSARAGADRNLLARLETQTAHRLLAPLYDYGRLAPSFPEAIRALRDAVEARRIARMVIPSHHEVPL